ncbi:MAG: hypothetical protein ACI8RD_007133 [Bacillariaceae sp.]|jgi:hypothetical protein
MEVGQSSSSSSNVDWPESDGSASAASAAAAVPVVTPEKNDNSISSNNNNSNSNSNNTKKKKMPSSYSYYSRRGKGRRGFQPPALQRQLLQQDKETSTSSARRLNNGGVRHLHQLHNNIRPSSESESKSKSESESESPATLPVPVVASVAAAAAESSAESSAGSGSGSGSGLQLELSDSERVDDEYEDLAGEGIGGNFDDDDDDDDDTNQKKIVIPPVPSSTTTTTTPLHDDDTLFGFNDCLVPHPPPVIQEGDDEDYSDDDDEKKKKKEDNNKNSSDVENKNVDSVEQEDDDDDDDDDDKTLSSYISTFERILSEDDRDGNHNSNNNNNNNTTDDANDVPSSRPQCTRVIAAVPESSLVPNATTTTTTPTPTPTPITAPRIHGVHVPIAPPSHDSSADSLVLPSIKRVTPRVYHRPHTNQTVVVGGGDVDGADNDNDNDNEEEEDDGDSKISADSTKARRAARIVAHNRSRKSSSSSSSSRPPKSSSRSGSSFSSIRRNSNNNMSSSSSSNRHSKISTTGSIDNDSTKSNNSNAMGHAVSMAFDKMLGFTAGVGGYHNTDEDHEYSSDEESESMVLDIRDALSTAFGCTAPQPLSPTSSHHTHGGSGSRIGRRRRNRIIELLMDDDSRTTVDSTVVSSTKKSTTRHARSGSNASAASMLSGISDGVGSIFSFDTTDELADFSKETSTPRKAAATAATAASPSLPPLPNNRSRPNFKVPDVFDSKSIHHSSSWNSVSSTGNNQKQPNAALYSKDLSHELFENAKKIAPVDLLKEGDNMFEEGKDLLKVANTKVDALMENANTKVDKFVEAANTKVDAFVVSIQGVLGNRFNQADLSSGSTLETLETLDTSGVLHTSNETTNHSLNMSVGDASDTMNTLVGTLSESLEVISETEAIHTTATAVNTTAEEISAAKASANLIVGKQSSSPGKNMDGKLFGENFTNNTIDTAKAGVKSVADNFKVDTFDGIFDTAKSFDSLFDTAAKTVVPEPEPSLLSSATSPETSLEIFEKSSEEGVEVDVFDDLLVSKVDVTKAAAPRKPKLRLSSFTRDAGAPDSAVKSLIGMFDSTVRERGSAPSSSPESNQPEVFEEKKEEEYKEEQKETAEDQDRRRAATHLITVHQETTNASTVVLPSKKEKEYLVWELPTAKDETDVPESQLDHATSLDVSQTSSEAKKTPTKFGGVRGLIRSFTKNKKGGKSPMSKSQSGVRARTPSVSKSSGDHAPLKKLEPEGIPSKKLEPEEVKEEPISLLTPYVDVDPDLDHFGSDMEIDREDDENIITPPPINEKSEQRRVESSTTGQDGNNKADAPVAPKGFEESFDTPVNFEKVLTRTQSNETSETDMIFDFKNCSAADEADFNVDGWVKFDDSKNGSMSQCPSTPGRIPSVVPDTPKTSNIGKDRIKKIASLTSLEEHIEETETSPFGTPFRKNGKFTRSITSAQFDDDVDDDDDAEAVTVNDGFNINNINTDKRDDRQPPSPDNNNDNNKIFIDLDQSGDWESFVGGFESKGFNTSISPQKVSAFPTF